MGLYENLMPLLRWLELESDVSEAKTNRRSHREEWQWALGSVNGNSGLSRVQKRLPPQLPYPRRSCRTASIFRLRKARPRGGSSEESWNWRTSTASDSG